jgi:succinoglycan biosynthesis protein ExoA
MALVASVVVACRNEKDHISACLESILASDYPQDRLEILVVDGMSTDGTRDVVQAIARRHKSVRLIDNTQQITSVAFNIGVRESVGDIILIMSAHARYPPDYVSLCERYLREYSADDIGGSMITVPNGDSVLARGIARVLSHPFGVGNARFRLRLSQPVWVDTVFGGCYRRDVFARIGLFDERLVRGWDMDFNTRLRRSGGRILLVPSIKVWYIPKGGLSGFVRQNFRDGAWAVRAIPLAGRTFRVRHFVPLAFVSVILLGGVLSLASAPVRLGLAGILAAYALLAAASGIQVALQERDARLVIAAPALFALRHFSYGCGSLIGLLLSLLPPRNVAMAKQQRRTTPTNS